MADDIQSNIRINVDTASAMDSIRLLQNQISAFHQQMSKMGAASVADSRNMQQNLINSINSTGQFAANITKIKTTAEQFSYSLEKNKLTMGEYFRYAGGATKTFGKLFAAEFETINKVARERVKDLQSQYIKLGRDANGAMQAIKVRPLTLDMENLGTKTQIAAQRQQLLNQLLRQGSTNLLNFGKNTQWAGRQLMVGFTVPLSIMGGAAMKAYREIEEASLRLKRVYGDFATTAQETDKVVKQVQQLSLEYTKYGIAVKDTMEVAATAAATGKKGADLLAQIASANKLSALGGIDQQKALQTTISLTDAFSISAKDLGKNINFLNAVENQTVLSIDDLTTAIPKAAPVIQQLGGDVKDLAFFLTAMKEGGINASEGANAIKSGLASIINPTNTASKMLQGFGINLRGIVEANKGDVKKTVVDFAQALDKLDPINRAKAIEQLFGKFQFARMSTLFKNVIEQGSQASEVLKLANESSLQLSILAQRELGKIEQSPLYKFQKAIADFQAQLAPVGEQFMKALTPIINFGTDVLKQFNNLGEGVKGFIVKTVAVAGVVGPVLLMSFGLIANAVANVIKGFALVKDIFNKTGKSSMSLGDQVSYMTREQIQAAAIASSLDQVHSKLKQTFTSEAAAVDALTAAYQRSAAAQKAFNVPITPRTPRGPVRKYAAGGIISGPGTGTSDSILAMVSNGEAIIPAASVARNPEMIRQLVSGNIPGFVLGTPGLNVAGRGYTSVRGHLTKERMLGDPGFSDIVSGSGFSPILGELGQYIKVVSNLVAEIPQSLNILLQEKMGRDGILRSTGASPEQFSQMFNQRQGKLLLSAKLGGYNIDSPDAMKQSMELEKQIHDRALTLAQGTEKQRVTDSLLAKATREVVDEAMVAGGELRQFATALDRSSKQVGQIRLSVPSDVIRQGLKSGKFTQNELGHVFSNGVQIGRISQSAENLGKIRPASAIKPTGSYNVAALRSVPVAEIEQAVSNDILAARQAVVTGVKKSTRQKSPSKDAFDAGANIGKGAIQGVQSQIDDAKTAGTQVGAAAAQGVSQSGRVAGKGGNRVATQEDFTPGNMVILNPNDIPNTANVKNNLVTSPSGLMTGKNMNFLKRQGLKLQSMDPGKLQGRMFGTSMGLGMASMFLPGELGQIAQAGSMATGFAGIFRDAGPKLGEALFKFGKPLTRLIPYVGAAVVAFEVFDKIVTPLVRKNADAYNAISDTLAITEEKLGKINNFFGTEIEKNALRREGAVIAEPGQTGKQASIAQQFRESQDFKDVYQESAQKMKSLSDVEFTRAIQALAIDLTGSGMVEEQVIAIVDAIKLEAGKTSITIDPKSFEINKDNNSSFMRGIQNAMTQFRLNFNTENDNENNPLFAFFNAESIAKATASASQFSSLLNGLVGQYEVGKISAKDFNQTFDDIEQSFLNSAKANPEAAFELLDTSVRNLNPALADLIAKVDDASYKFTLLKANAMGLAIPEQVAAILDAGGDRAVQQEKLINQSITKAQKIKDNADNAKKSIAALQKQNVDLNASEQKINDKYDKRIAQIEKIKKLNEQIANSQKGQLTLAEALNRGDIAAAAAAAMDIEKANVQNALDNQQTGLTEARAAEVKPLRTQATDNQQQIAALNQTITNADISASKVTIQIAKAADVEDKVSLLRPEFNSGGGVLIPPSQVDASHPNARKFTLDGISQLLKAPNTRKDIKPGFVWKNADGTRWKIWKLEKGPGAAVPNVIYADPYAMGGHIKGPGSGTSDDIPAMLSNGEYVIRANAVKTIGVDTLDKLNQADRIGFAAGGMVDKFKKKKPKPKPYTLDDLRKPISEKDDPEWYDYSYNFLKERPKGLGIFRNYKYSSASSGFYRAKGPSEVRGQRDLIDYDGEKPEFTSVAATIKYYKGLIESRRAGVPHIDDISQDPFWTGMGIPKAKVRQSNRIDNRTFGKYDGLDKIEARTLASAMTRLFGKDKVGEGFKALGLSTDLLTNKTMFNNVTERLAYERYTRNDKKNYPMLSPNTPKYAEGGFVGPRPAPQWDEKGRWVVSRGESYWSTAENTLPGGMSIGPWWSRILKSNIDPETGKERRLYRNSRIWIPGSKQPYPPKSGEPFISKVKTPTPSYGMFGRLGTGENHLGFMGVGGFGMMKQYANGGLVGYEDGGLVGSLFGNTQSWLNNLILSMFNSGGNPSAALNATSADAIKTGVKEGKNFTRDYIFDPTNPVDYAMAAIPGGKIVQGIGKGFNAAKGAVKGKIATMNAKKVLGIMGGKEAAKLTPGISLKMTRPGLEKFLAQEKYKTIHQGVPSSAGDSIDERSLVEAATGMNKALKLKPGQSPAYGFLGTKEAIPNYFNSIYGGIQSGRTAAQQSTDKFLRMTNPNSRPLQSYGSSIINLKPGALRNATVSFGDSLSIYQQAVKAGVKTPQVMKLGSLLTTLKLSSMARKTKDILGKDFEMPYAEIHMGSGFGIDDVSSIGVSTEWVKEVPKAISSMESLLAQAGKSNIPVFDIIGRGKNAAAEIGENIPKPLSGMIQKPNNPFSPVLGPMQGPGLPFGFSKAPTKSEMDAVIKFVQNSPLAQIERGDALASIVAKSTIGKGNQMFRVPTIKQSQELATKKVGDIINLGKRFSSIAPQSELQAIGMTAAGKLNTGNRELPVNTIIKFIANEDIPGIMNHNVYNPNYLKSAFGNKAYEYPFQSEGVLPPGLKGKIVDINQSGDQKIIEILLSKFADGGMVGRYAKGGFVMPTPEPIPAQFANGGMVRASGNGMMSNGRIVGGYSGGGMVPGYSMGGMVPEYFADGGYAMGTDTVPAMLTPGEFVIKKSAVDRIGTSALNRINNGYADGGIVGASSGGPTGEGIFTAEPSNSVYNNTYEINVNVRSESNAEEIARTVLSRIKQVDNQRVRGINGR